MALFALPSRRNPCRCAFPGSRAFHVPHRDAGAWPAVMRATPIFVGGSTHHVQAICLALLLVLAVASATTCGSASWTFAAEKEACDATTLCQNSLYCINGTCTLIRDGDNCTEFGCGDGNFLSCVNGKCLVTSRFVIPDLAVRSPSLYSRLHAALSAILAIRMLSASPRSATTPPPPAPLLSRTVSHSFVCRFALALRSSPHRRRLRLVHWNLRLGLSRGLHHRERHHRLR